MKRFCVTILACGLFFCTAPAAQGQENRPHVSSNEEQALVQADHALAEALRKADQAAADKLLDEQFEWTDMNGKTAARAESLRNLAALAQDGEEDTGVKTHSYGELGIVFGFHHGARFARIWVKRSAGWKALVFLDTPKPSQASPAVAGGNAGDCNNPCTSLPYAPTTATDQAVIAEWQKTKMDEWHPDAADWATHVADEFLIINDRAERNKEQRVALARKWQDAGISMPGDPVLSMSMSDFGNTVLMISRHAPYRGGKPYYNARVFVHRDGHWLIAWSQQTTIQDAPAIPPVTRK
jgi:hypothetical protein